MCFQAAGEGPDSENVKSPMQGQNADSACWRQDPCLLLSSPCKTRTGERSGHPALLSHLLLPPVHTGAFVSLFCSIRCHHCLLHWAGGSWCCVWEDGAHSTPHGQGCWLLTMLRMACSDFPYRAPLADKPAVFQLCLQRHGP